jgi:PilZ domain
MLNRRIELRLLCADLVDIDWRDQSGRLRRGVANLEDISQSGACLQVEKPVALGAPLRLTYPGGVLLGRVKYCVFREIGYFLGVEFEPGQRWSRQDYRPQHMLDPRRLVQDTLAIHDAGDDAEAVLQ